MRRLLFTGILILAISGVLAGLVYYYSQDIQDMKELTDYNFVELTGIGSGKNLTQEVFIIVYDPACSHCGNALIEFNLLATQLPSIRVFKMHRRNRLVLQQFNIQSMPTMLFFTKDGQFKNYQRGRSVDRLIQYATTEYKTDNIKPYDFTPINPNHYLWDKDFFKVQLINTIVQLGGPLKAPLIIFGNLLLILSGIVAICKIASSNSKLKQKNNQNKPPHSDSIKTGDPNNNNTEDAQENEQNNKGDQDPATNQ